MLCSLFFKVPFVPLIPTLSNLVNATLVVHLPPITWLRLAIWLLVGKRFIYKLIQPFSKLFILKFFLGFLLYFCYGMRHSSENKKDAEYKSIVETRSTAATPTVDSLQQTAVFNEDGSVSIGNIKKSASTTSK